MIFVLGNLQRILFYHSEMKGLGLEEGSPQLVLEKMAKIDSSTQIKFHLKTIVGSNLTVGTKDRAPPLEQYRRPASTFE